MYNNEEFLLLTKYCQVRKIKADRMGRHVTGTGEVRNMCKVSFVTPDGKSHLGEVSSSMSILLNYRNRMRGSGRN
jgi:hypothetical protein